MWPITECGWSGFILQIISVVPLAWIEMGKQPRFDAGQRSQHLSFYVGCFAQQTKAFVSYQGSRLTVRLEKRCQQAAGKLIETQVISARFGK